MTSTQLFHEPAVQTGDLFPQDDLLRRFVRVHNFIYANDGLSSQQALEEIVKLLFVKLYDEHHSKEKPYPAIPKYNQVIDLVSQVKKEYSTVFEKDEKLRLSKKTLQYVLNQIWPISIVNSSTDAKGLAFQKFLSHCEKDGRGQFFTPKPVVDFCVDIIDPKFGELIIDPACGSGGFLLSILRKILEDTPKDKVEEIIKNNIFGCDINSSAARIAGMRLLLEANEKINIYCTNAIDNIEAFSASVPESMCSLLDGGFDVVLTNPPFGTAGKIIDVNILRHFELGYKWILQNGIYSKSSTMSKGQPAEVLFIERCLQLLKDGGRMGIVLPNGFFENPSLGYLRAYVRRQAKILSIVSLPQETFIPYGTGVKTSLLFLQKQECGHSDRDTVFFGSVRKVGYRGNKFGSPLFKRDAHGKIRVDAADQSVLEEDFSEVVFEYRKFLSGGDVKSARAFSGKLMKVDYRWDSKFYEPRYRQVVSRLSKGGAIRLCDIADVVRTKFRRSDIRGMVRYIELSDVNIDFLEIANATEHLVGDLPSRASYMLKAGDIVTAVAGNSVGTRKHATAMIGEEYEECVCSNGFRVLRNFRIDPYFLLFFMRTDWFLDQMYMYRTGATIPNVSDADFGQILIMIPKEAEMGRISSEVRKSLELRDRARRTFAQIKL